MRAPEEIRAAFPGCWRRSLQPGDNDMRLRRHRGDLASGAGAARQGRRPHLRRLMDGMGRAARRAGRHGRRMSANTVETTVTFLEDDGTAGAFPADADLASPGADEGGAHSAPFLPLPLRHRRRDWLWVERHGLSRRSLASKVQRDGIEISVLYANGAPAGYYELDFAAPERANLAYFGLFPEWVGMKIGPWLLGCAVRDAFSHGRKRGHRQHLHPRPSRRAAALPAARLRAAAPGRAARPRPQAYERSRPHCCPHRAMRMERTANAAVVSLDRGGLVEGNAQ